MSQPPPPQQNQPPRPRPQMQGQGGPRPNMGPGGPPPQGMGNFRPGPNQNGPPRPGFPPRYPPNQQHPNQQHPNQQHPNQQHQGPSRPTGQIPPQQQPPNMGQRPMPLGPNANQYPSAPRPQQPNPQSPPPQNHAQSNMNPARRRMYPNQPDTSLYNQPPQVNEMPNDYQPQLFVPGESQNQNQNQPQQGYPQAYPYQQQDSQYNYDPNNLTTPMANMNIQSSGLVENPLQTTPLLHFQPKMHELNELPPIPKIPQESMINPTSSHLVCDIEMQRTTLNAFPATPALLKKSNLPLGLIITPFKTLGPEQYIPVLYEIIRCRACRTYINPFVTFVQTKWKCNVCNLHNDLPQSFDYDLNTRQPIDRFQRPEVTHAVVDYSAPVEYMVRAPQPPIYFFVIDVSYASVQSGIVAAIAKTILDSLDRIPNADQRVKVGFMTFDSSLHFYKLDIKSSEPQMLVVADLEEVYLPSPEDLLVNLVEARPAIESLLSRLGLMFKSTQNVQSALGPALQSAQKILTPSGGKIINFQTILPTIQSGDLTIREDPKILGTAKESSLLNPASSFYKNFALDCSRAYIGIDMFLFGGQYMDIATLSSAPKYTGGHLYHYPGFNAQRTEDITKLRHEVSEFLANEVGLEAVLRLRCSQGIRTDAYFGNFFLRASQLLSLPNVTPDHCYTVELSLEDKLETPIAIVQSALLYTSSTGERRIRVMTSAIPTTSNISELYQSADQTAMFSFIAKKAVDRALTSKLEDARDALINKCAQILHTFKTELTSSSSGATTHLPICSNLRHYPFMTLAMLKNISLRAGSTTTSDIRSAAINFINLSPPEFLTPFLAPKLYALHELPEEAGTIDNEGKIILPTPLNLRSDSINSQGVYLLDNTQRAMIYVGTRADPRILNELFSVNSYGSLFGGKVSLPLLDTKLSKRVQAILNQHRKIVRDTYYQETFIVKEDGDPALRLLFLTYLVEDRTNTIQSYYQFIAQLKEMVNSGKI
ncbi:hypothetical protein K502DRAFT_322991 [Neoconidiobolus thromboides FSU 785]|nr:hypothetical protein K502DRAFT_322991 [Neoconidiobolus thromboides FSU 785]